MVMVWYFIEQKRTIMLIIRCGDKYQRHPHWRFTNMFDDSKTLDSPSMYFTIFYIIHFLLINWQLFRIGFIGRHCRTLALF